MKLACFFALSALSLLFISSDAFNSAQADEGMATKTENKAGDIKTDAQKKTRAAKRHVRKAAGTDNVAKDAKDKGQDAAADASNGANKLTR